MKKIVKLTESDLHKLVGNVVKKVIKENSNEPIDVTQSFVSAILETKHYYDSWDNGMYRNVEVHNKAGESFIFDLYINRSFTPAIRSNDYDVPDDPGDTRLGVEIYDVVAYDADDEEISPITFDEDEILETLYDLCL